MNKIVLNEKVNKVNNFNSNCLHYMTLNSAPKIGDSIQANIGNVYIIRAFKVPGDYQLSSFSVFIAEKDKKKQVAIIDKIRELQIQTIHDGEKPLWIPDSFICYQTEIYIGFLFDECSIIEHLLKGVTLDIISYAPVEDAFQEVIGFLSQI